VKVGGYASKREMLDIMCASLNQERESFIPHWRELSDFLLPRRSRWVTTDVNKGDRRNSKIQNSAGTLALRVFAAGMQSGMTNPARPWFRLGVEGSYYDEDKETQYWLEDLTRGMRYVMARTNLYQSFLEFYRDLGGFGISPIFVEEDLDRVFHTRVFPIGSYAASCNRLGQVDVFKRDFRMTVRQVLEEFNEGDELDVSKFSGRVVECARRGNLEEWVDVTHVIHPNPEYDEHALEAKYKRYSSCYFETGDATRGASLTDSDRSKYLRESGYDYFPVLVGRWDVTGEDVYPTDCPGMTALSDVKELQHATKMRAKGVTKLVDPSLQAPSSAKSVRVTQLPGDITYFDSASETAGIRPLHLVDPRILEIKDLIAELKDRVDEAFYRQLFATLLNTDRRDMTAREVDEVHEEKMSQIGPTLERLNQEMLDPLIRIVYALMLKQGRVPPPPKRLQGVDLKIEYTSVMAQAAQLTGLAGLERLTSYVGSLAQITQDPSVIDKLNTDEAIDEYANIVGAPKKTIRSDDEAEARRAARAQQAAAQQRMEAVAGLAGAAKDLSGASLEGDTALTRMIDMNQAGQIAPAP
jgi:hypothetical protein